jgi:Ca2+-binding RTX toxin-like protein
MLERLEKRTHLTTTATLDPDSHILTITGSSAFAIKITLDAQLNNIVVKNSADGFNKQFAKAQVQSFNIAGTSGSDSLNIAAAITVPAVCSMGDGNDTVMSALGNDSIDAGFGNDSIDGGGGKDSINAGRGDDVIVHTFASAGALEGLAFIFGGRGNDSIDFTVNRAKLFDTKINVNGLTAQLNGIEEAILTGGGGGNLIDASNFTGNVTIFGMGGDDTLSGGAGNDVLLGGDGNDILFGFGGSDQLSGGLGADSIFGGTGKDLLFEDNADVKKLVLSNDAMSGLGKDSLSRIESAILVGGASANLFDTGAFTGPVTLNGEAGNDTLVSGSGNDLLSGGADDDSINGNGGSDTLVETADVNFTLTNTSITGLGNDTIRRIEQARLFSGDSDNLLDASAFTIGPVTLSGGAGDDTLRGGPRNDQLKGGDGADMLFGNGGADLMLGGAGNDTLTGGAGPDTLHGEADDDKFDALDGTSDEIDGGSGTGDSILSKDSSDVVTHVP